MIGPVSGAVVFLVGLSVTSHDEKSDPAKFLLLQARQFSFRALHSLAVKGSSVFFCFSNNIGQEICSGPIV